MRATPLAAVGIAALAALALVYWQRASIVAGVMNIGGAVLRVLRSDMPVIRAA